MINTVKIRMLIVILVTIATVGCVQQRPIPSYAKSGETIILGLGGIHRNALSNQHLKPSDLIITLTDSLDQQFSLQAVEVYKAYPDYNSVLNTQAVTDGYGIGLQPFDGGWFVAVKLLDSVTSLPVAASSGDGFISITSNKLRNTRVSGNEGDLNHIPIEILPGIATVDSKYERQFGQYRSTDDHFIVRPAGFDGIDFVGGANIVVEYSGAGESMKLMVLPSSHNPYTQINYNIIDNGDGTGTIKAILLNPAGFTTTELRRYNSSLLTDLQMHFQPIDALASVSYQLNRQESYYIDLEGNVLSELIPELRLQNDL